MLRYDGERHWLRAAHKRVGHLFPRLLRQSEYNERIKAAVPLMGAALRWLAGHTPGSAEPLRLMDATPVPCGQSAVTTRRSGLHGYPGYGYCPSHSRRHWGAKLMLTCTCDGTVTGFGLANPKLSGERGQARQMSLVAARPGLGPAIEHATPAGSGGLGDVEEHFAAYLDAEKKLGRIAPDTDTQTHAFALLGSVHHLAMTNPAGLPDLADRIRRIVTALVAGMQRNPG